MEIQKSEQEKVTGQLWIAAAKLPKLQATQVKPLQKLVESKSYLKGHLSHEYEMEKYKMKEMQKQVEAQRNGKMDTEE